MPPSAVVTILTGWKLKTAMSDQRHAADRLAAVASRRRVRGVLDDAEAVVACASAQIASWSGALAAEVHRDDDLGQAAGAPCASRSLCCQRRHADVAGARIDVDEIDVGAAVARAVGRGDEGVGHGPQHIARAERRAPGRRCAAPRWRCSPRPRAARGTAPRTPPRSAATAGPCVRKSERSTCDDGLRCRPRRVLAAVRDHAAASTFSATDLVDRRGSADCCRSCIRSPRPPASRFRRAVADRDSRP